MSRLPRLEAQKSLPGQADVYYVPELTEFSEGYMLDPAQQERYVHTVFPSVSMDKQDGKYRRYDGSSLMRNKMEKRADGGESAGSGFKSDLLDVHADVWAWHTDIGPQTYANAAGSYDLDNAAAAECTAAAMTNREFEWINTFFKTGIWGTEFDFDATPSGGQRLSWMDAASDPIKDMRDALTLQEHKSQGRRARLIVFAEDVWNRLMVHPLVRTLLSGGQMAGGFAPQNPTKLKSMLAEILEVEQIRIAKALYTTSADGDPNATYDVISGGGKVGMFYYPDRPSIITPSAGYTFNWTGYIGANEMGGTITRETIPLTRGAQRTEIEQAYGFKLVSPACGVFFDHVLDT